jgi:acyl-CoA thioester hydrolase
MPHKADYKILWSHIDMNRHLRHSAYSDFATQARMDMMKDCGIDMKVFEQFHFGPVIFKEEIKYLREFEIGDKLSVHTELAKWNKRRHFWTMNHQIIKNDDKVSAKIIIKGAWLDVANRKMMLLNEELLSYVEKIPKSEKFEEV